RRHRPRRRASPARLQSRGFESFVPSGAKAARSLTPRGRLDSFMDNEKDRFGDKLRDAEHAREDKFFAERDRELLEKLRREVAAEGAPSCPICNAALERIDDPPLRLYACGKLHGWWIAGSDLQTGDEAGVCAAFGRLLAVARRRA